MVFSRWASEAEHTAWTHSEAFRTAHGRRRLPEHAVLRSGIRAFHIVLPAYAESAITTHMAGRTQDDPNGSRVTRRRSLEEQMQQYRADHVGSLTRPEELKGARTAFRAGQLSRDALREVEDRAILDALAHQRQVGMPIFSDGEFRRDAWQTDLSDAVAGFVEDYPVVTQTLPDGRTVELEMHTKAVRDRVRAVRRITAGFVPFLKAHSPGPFKVTLPSPAMASRGGFRAGLTDRVYATRHELLADFLPIYQDEMRALVADGVAYVQMDEGFISYVNDNWRDGLREQGLDPERELAADIAAENACWDLLPPDQVARAMHICRGSRTTARGSGGYEWLAEHLFDQLHVDRFLLEYDSQLVGGFEPLRFLPAGKTVVLGLITSKDPTLESEDQLLRRIEEASKYAAGRAARDQSAVRLRRLGGQRVHEPRRAVAKAGARGSGCRTGVGRDARRTLTPSPSQMKRGELGRPAAPAARSASSHSHGVI